MKLHSKPYGMIEIDERQVLELSRGLLGFEQYHRYALLDAPQKPFYWLQSLDVPDLAFVLIDPTVFRPDYRPEAAEADLEDLTLEAAEDLLVFAIVTIPDNQTKLTANLQGPILVNRRNRLARQIISLNPDYHVRHFILEELALVREEQC